jgi:gliding motility-associated-like protein
MRFLFVISKLRLSTIVLMLASLLFITNIHANKYWVTSTADSGPGTLRESIILANNNPGLDSILFNIKGTINVITPIEISNYDLDIVGPGSGNVLLSGSSTSIFEIAVGSSTVYISSLSFTNTNGSAIEFSQGHLEIVDCIFKQCTVLGNGGAIRMDNPAFLLNVDRCSFVDNRANGTGLGGSIYSNGGDVFVTNSTFGNTIGFGGNNATNGGALYIANGSNQLYIVNNTFARLSTGGQGGAVWLNNSNLSLNIINNIFYQNNGTIPTQDLFSQTNLPMDNNARNYNNFGGATTNNNYNPSTEDFWGTTGSNSWRTWVQTGANGTLYLTETGRGHYILNISDPNAPFIDNGSPVHPFTAVKDVRHAPRILQGIFYGTESIDRGSMEYSPFCVTNNNALGAGSLANIIDSVNNSVRPGALYIWFEIPTAGPHTILATSQYITYRSNTILDGYSQSGCKEGAKSFGPEYMIDIVDNASLTACFYTFGNYTEVIGFKIQYFDTPILLYSSYNKIFGNHLIASQYAIISDFSVSGYNQIGSSRGKDRNYIVGSTAKAMEIGGPSNSIQGNYVGVNPNGTIGGNNEGIDLNDASFCTVGGFDPDEGNLVSGSTLYGLRLFESSNCEVRNNIFGVNTTLTSTTGFENGSGIVIENSYNNYIGGDVYPSGGNVIVSSLLQGVLVKNSEGQDLVGNIIGLYPDGETNGSVGGAGVEIEGYTDYNTIGSYWQGNGGNVISNCEYGIYSHATSGYSTDILKNKIGSDISGTMLKGNQKSGIYVQGDFSGYTQAYINENLIVGHQDLGFGYGIHVDNASISAYNNRIGLDTSDNPLPNRVGILIENVAEVSNNLGDNVIAYSQGLGVWVKNSNTVDIDYCTIRNSGQEGVYIEDNSKSIYFSSNTVINNGFTGLKVTNDCDSLVFRGNIIHSNGGSMDYDLGNTGPDGYTMNQAIPVPILNSALYCGGELSVNGFFSFPSYPDESVIIEFYYIPSGQGNGANRGGSHGVIGSSYYNLDGSGEVYFNFQNEDFFTTGDMVTAVVSLVDPVWGEGTVFSSEFSENMIVSSGVSVTVSHSNASCSNLNDGSASATVMGSANTPMWFTASDLMNPIWVDFSVFNLGAGDYVCVIEDGACSDTAYFTITEPTTLLAGGILLTNTSCNGLSDGVIEFQGANGGTAPYSYSIDGGSNLTSITLYNNLLPGNYPLKVQDINGCEIDSIVPIMQPDAIIVSESITPLTCFGSNDGDITINVIGGVPGYSYSWQGPNSFTSFTQNISDIEAGNYDIQVIDLNGCIYNQTFVVNQPAQNNVNFTMSNATPCTGEGVTFTNTSDAGATSFFWDFGNGDPTNNTLENSSTNYASAGAFNVKFIVTYGICQDSLTQVINVNPTPFLSSANNTQICSGDNVNFTFTSTQPASSFSWSAIDNTNVTGETFTVQNTALNNDQLINVSGSPQLVEYIVTTSTALCSNSGESFNVWVYPLPVVTATSNSPICEGNIINLSGMPNGGSFYQWTGPNFYSASTQNATIPVASGINAGTYTLTVTDNEGCQGVGNTTVVVDPLPLLTSTLSYFLCSDEEVNLTLTSNIVGATFSWIANDNVNVFGESLSTQNSNVINDMLGNSSASAQTVVYTVIPTSPAGCVGNAELVNISVDAIPMLTSPNSSTLCSGDAVNFALIGNAVTNSFSWIASDNINISGESLTIQTSNPIPDILVNNSGSTQSVFYSVSALTANMCTSNPMNVTITVEPLNTVSGPNISPTVCFNMGIPAISHSTTGATGIGTATGLPFGVNASFAANTITIVGTPTVAGIFNYTIPLTGGCGNVNATGVITVNQLPNVTITNNSPVCVGSDINFLGMPSGASSYQWTGPALLPSIQNPVKTNALLSDAGTYTLTVIDANGCQNSANTNIFVNPLPTVTATSDSPVCEGSDINLTGTPNGASSYTWVGPSFSATTQNATVSGATLANSGTYTLTVIDGNGCQNIGNTTVVVNALPVVTANNSGPVCEGVNVNLTGTPNGASTYTWSGPLFSATTQNATVSVATLANAGTYTLTVVDGNGCQNTENTIVVVNSLPVVTATSNSPVCEGQDVNLSGSPTPLATYSWSGPSFSATTQNATVSGVTLANAGTYTLTVVDGDGCQNTDDVIITINSLPNVSAPSDFTICAGESAVLNGSGASSYSWDNGVTDGVSFVPPSGTSTTYTVVGVDINGCENSDQMVITVSDIINLVLNVSDVSCNGLMDGEIEYGATGGIAPYTIEINGASPVVLSPNPTVLSGLSGGFDFNAIVYDANGCSASNSATINEPGDITFNLNVFSDTCNQGVGYVQYTNIVGGVTPYLYFDLLGNFVSSDMVYGVAGTYSMMVLDGNGCQSSSQEAILLNFDAPVVGGVNDDVEICPEETVELNAFGGSTYSWTGANLSSNSVANPIADPTTTTLYFVTISNGSCQYVDSVFVTVLSNCEVVDTNTVVTTNAFSPNGDGINDYVRFDIDGLLNNHPNRVFIFNRWGDLIREFDNYNNTDVVWDGTGINGSMMPAGTYFYIIEINDIDYKASGWIQLVR